jgi:short-subunit dehydrogenase
VTGASSGIGSAIAHQLAASGFDLVVCAADAEIARTADDLRRLGVEVTATQTDLRDPDEVDALWAVASAGNPPDVVVVNAGVAVGGGTFAETSLTDHLDVVQLNVRSTVHLTGLAVTDMLRRRTGRILITSSLVAGLAGPYQTTYNASKAFLASFAAGLRHELRRSSVSVTTLLPGPVDTPFFARARMSHTLLGRMPKERADVVARQAVRALLRGRPTVIGGRVIGAPAALLIAVLPQGARTRLQAVLSRPWRGA